MQNDSLTEVVIEGGPQPFRIEEKNLQFQNFAFFTSLENFLN